MSRAGDSLHCVTMTVFGTQWAWPVVNALRAWRDIVGPFLSFEKKELFLTSFLRLLSVILCKKQGLKSRNCILQYRIKTYMLTDCYTMYIYFR